jgi:hypothetical protein
MQSGRTQIEMALLVRSSQWTRSMAASLSSSVAPQLLNFVAGTCFTLPPTADSPAGSVVVAGLPQLQFTDPGITHPRYRSAESLHHHVSYAFAWSLSSFARILGAPVGSGFTVNVETSEPPRLKPCELQREQEEREDEANAENSDKGEQADAVQGLGKAKMSVQFEFPRGTEREYAKVQIISHPVR